MPEELTNEEKASREEKIEKLRTGELIVAKTLEENTRLKKELGIESNGGGGSGGPVTTLEAFQKLSPAERTQFYREHPTEYSKFMDRVRTEAERALFDKKGAGTL